MSFAEMVGNVLKHEGGFVDDKDDSGGPTKYGITQKTLAHYLGREITRETVKNMSRELATEVYFKLYYEHPKVNLLPELVQPVIFDAAVNMGTVAAIKLAQKVFNKMGTPITCDGIIGQKTLMSAKAACNVYGHEVVVSIVNARVHYYETICDFDPVKKKYLKGWVTRARSFI